MTDSRNLAGLPERRIAKGFTWTVAHLGYWRHNRILWAGEQRLPRSWNWSIICAKGLAAGFALRRRPPFCTTSPWRAGRRTARKASGDGAHPLGLSGIRLGPFEVVVPRSYRMKSWPLASAKSRLTRASSPPPSRGEAAQDCRRAAVPCAPRWRVRAGAGGIAAGAIAACEGRLSPSASSGGMPSPRSATSTTNRLPSRRA